MSLFEEFSLKPSYRDADVGTVTVVVEVMVLDLVVQRREAVGDRQDGGAIDCDRGLNASSLVPKVDHLFPTR